jgi:hypothetical protein
LNKCLLEERKGGLFEFLSLKDFESKDDELTWKPHLRTRSTPLSREWEGTSKFDVFQSERM